MPRRLNVPAPHAPYRNRITGQLIGVGRSVRGFSFRSQALFDAVIWPRNLIKGHEQGAVSILAALFVTRECNNRRTSSSTDLTCMNFKKYFMACQQSPQCSHLVQQINSTSSQPLVVGYWPEMPVAQQRPVAPSFLLSVGICLSSRVAIIALSMSDRTLLSGPSRCV